MRALEVMTTPTQAPDVSGPTRLGSPVGHKGRCGFTRTKRVSMVSSTKNQVLSYGFLENGEESAVNY